MLDPAAQTDPASAPDPRVVHAEERLARLREVSEITMAVMRAQARHTIETLEAPQAAAPNDGAAPGRDPVEVIAKLSRIVRLTTTLEAKLEDALTAYLSGETAKAEARRASSAATPSDPVSEDPHAAPRARRKARVRQLIRDVVDRETPDPVEYDAIVDALDERLTFDRAYADIDDLPLKDIVSRLCADLKLRPDWNRWTGEGWEPNPPFFRPLCSPFAEPSRWPILEHGPDPSPRERPPAADALARTRRLDVKSQIIAARQARIWPRPAAAPPDRSGQA